MFLAGSETQWNSRINFTIEFQRRRETFGQSNSVNIVTIANPTLTAIIEINSPLPSPSERVTASICNQLFYYFWCKNFATYYALPETQTRL
jgi:hypothetical protein